MLQEKDRTMADRCHTSSGSAAVTPLPLPHPDCTLGTPVEAIPQPAILPPQP